MTSTTRLPATRDYDALSAELYRAAGAPRFVRAVVAQLSAASRFERVTDTGPAKRERHPLIHDGQYTSAGPVIRNALELGLAEALAVPLTEKLLAPLRRGLYASFEPARDGGPVSLKLRYDYELPNVMPEAHAPPAWTVDTLELRLLLFPTGVTVSDSSLAVQLPRVGPSQPVEVLLTPVPGREERSLDVYVTQSDSAEVLQQHRIDVASMFTP